MRILVVCQYYYPEPFRISDICEELVRQGYEVTVLTGIPNYPEGKIYSGYDNVRKKEEIINGVHVIRSYTIPRKKGSLYRLLNYYSYAVSSCLKVLLNQVKSADGKDFDVVFVNQLSPVMMAYAGMLYSWKHDKKLIMYCLDLWPESLVAGGIKKDSLVYKVFNKISRHIYRSCDHILVTSQSFIEHLSNRFNIDKTQISYLPQYAEDIFNSLTTVEHNNFINLVFAGNIGEVQDVETIIRAAEILKSKKDLLFHIVGGGTDLARLKNMVAQKELNNVVFYGRRPIEEMPKFYAMADAMLVTLANDPLLSMTLPGKVQSYMAAGKPIIGAIDGETSFIIRDSMSGYVSASGDAKALADNITDFCKLNSFDKTLLGDNARKYYDDKFTKSKFVAKLTIDYL